MTGGRSGAGAAVWSASFFVLNRQRGHLLDRKEISTFLTRATDEMNPGGDFSVVVISDRAMRRYNRDFRNYDKATDVLSFPGEGDYLGDILISADTAWRQSERSQTLTFESNLCRLALHGLLHLMGYDHETDNGEMRALETRLRRRFRC